MSSEKPQMDNEQEILQLDRQIQLSQSQTFSFDKLAIIDQSKLTQKGRKLIEQIKQEQDVDDIKRIFTPNTADPVPKLENEIEIIQIEEPKYEIDPKQVVIKIPRRRIFKAALILFPIIIISIIGLLVYLFVFMNQEDEETKRLNSFQINQEMSQTKNILQRVFYPNYTYNFNSSIESSFNGHTTNFTYTFGVICRSFDERGYNMIMYMKAIVPNEGEPINLQENTINVINYLKNQTKQRNLRENECQSPQKQQADATQILQSSQNILKGLKHNNRQNVNLNYLQKSQKSKSFRYLQTDSNQSFWDGQAPTIIFNTLDTNASQVEIQETFYNRPNPNNETIFREETNENEYAGEKDENYIPSIEREMISSQSIVNFNLSYEGYLKEIQFGIGINYDLFSIIRKLLIQIFPKLELEKYQNITANYDMLSSQSYETSANQSAMVKRFFNQSKNGSTQLRKISVNGNKTSKDNSITNEINTFDPSGNLLWSFIDSVVEQFQMDGQQQSSSSSSTDSNQGNPKKTTTIIKQNASMTSMGKSSEDELWIGKIFEQEIMDTMIRDFQYLDQIFLPNIEQILRYRNTSEEGSHNNSTSCLQQNHHLSDGQSCTNCRILQKSDVILIMEPISLLKFQVLSLNVEAKIESTCYATQPGQDDICEIDLTANFLGIRLPIVPTQTVKAKISQLVQKFQFFRENIMKKIDIIDSSIVKEIKTFSQSLLNIRQSLNDLLDPSKYQQYLKFKSILDQFTLTLNSTLRDTQNIFQTLSYDVIDSMDAIFQSVLGRFEDILYEKIQNVNKKVMRNIHGYGLMVQKILQKSFSLNQTVQASQTDLDEIINVIETLTILQEDLLFESDDLILHYDGLYLKPLELVNKQILLSLDKFFDKQPNLFSKFEKKAKEILKVFSHKQVENTYLNQYTQIMMNIDSFKQKVSLNFDSFSSVLTEIKNNIQGQIDPNLSSATLGIGESLWSAILLVGDGEIDYDSDEMGDSEFQQLIEYLGTSIVTENQERVLNLKSKMENMIVDLQKNFLENLKSMKTKIVDFGLNLQEVLRSVSTNIRSVKDSFKLNILNTVNHISDALILVFTNKNQKNIDLKSAKVKVDFNDLSHFIPKLLSIFDDTQTIKQNFEKLMEVDDLYKNIENEISSLKAYPITWEKIIQNFTVTLQQFSQKSIKLPFDYQPLVQLFTDQKGTLIKAIDNSILSLARKQGIKVITDTIDQYKDSIMGEVLKAFKSKITSASGTLVQPFLNNILGQFISITRVLYQQEFKKVFQHEYYFPTPVGFPVVVKIFLGFGATAQVFFGIKGTVVEIGAGAGVYLFAGGSGAFTIPMIIEVGVMAEVRSSVNANAYIRTGFKDKFYAGLQLGIVIKPLTLSFGLYLKYPTIQWYCIGGRRRNLDKRSLENEELIQNALKNSFYQYFRASILTYKKLEFCNTITKLDVQPVFYVDNSTVSESSLLESSQRRILGWGWFKICLPYIALSEPAFILGPYEIELFPPIEKKFEIRT